MQLQLQWTYLNNNAFTNTCQRIIIMTSSVSSCSSAAHECHFLVYAECTYARMHISEMYAWDVMNNLIQWNALHSTFLIWHMYIHMLGVSSFRLLYLKKASGVCMCNVQYQHSIHSHIISNVLNLFFTYTFISLFLRCKMINWLESL